MFNIRNISFILLGLYLIMNYTSSQHLYITGTMFPTPNIDPAADCEILYNISKSGERNQAMKEQIVAIATTRWLPHRLKVRSLFQKQHGRDLLRDLSHYFRPNVANAVTTLFKSPAEIYAEAIYLAMFFFKADNNTLIEIMCCIVDASMDDIAAAYKKEHFGADMRSDIQKISYGEYRNLLLALTQEKRRGLYPSETFEKGVAGADDCSWISPIWSGLIKIFSKGSYSEIVHYARNHQKKTGHTLDETLKLKAPNDVHFRKLLLEILEYAKSPANYYSRKLHTFFQNPKLHIKEDKKFMSFPWLTRVLTLRSELDLDDIADKYQKLGYNYLEEDMRIAFDGNGLLKKIYENLIVGNVYNNTNRRKPRPKRRTTRKATTRPTKCKSRRCRPQ